jgi:hypothetical protein
LFFLIAFLTASSYPSNVAAFYRSYACLRERTHHLLGSSGWLFNLISTVTWLRLPVQSGGLLGYPLILVGPCKFKAEVKDFQNNAQYSHFPIGKVKYEGPSKRVLRVNFMS